MPLSKRPVISKIELVKMLKGKYMIWAALTDIVNQGCNKQWPLNIILCRRQYIYYRVYTWRFLRLKIYMCIMSSKEIIIFSRHELDSCLYQVALVTKMCDQISLLSRYGQLRSLCMLLKTESARSSCGTWLSLQWKKPSFSHWKRLANFQIYEK